MIKAKIRKTEYYYVDLRQIRIDKGYTIRELCKKLKMDPSNYSKMEQGELPMDEDLYKKIVILCLTKKGRFHYLIEGILSPLKEKNWKL